MAATRLSDSQKQELVARFCGGASLQQLAKLFGCSPTTVSRTAKAAIDLADYEQLLKQLKAQRGGSSQSDAAHLGELPFEIEENSDAGSSPGVEAPIGLANATDLGKAHDHDKANGIGDGVGGGDAVGFGDPVGCGDVVGLGDALGDVDALIPTEDGEQPELATTLGSYGLEEPSQQPSQDSSPEPGSGLVELASLETSTINQGTLELSGGRDQDAQSAALANALPSPIADTVAEPPTVPDVPRPILGRRRRSGAAISSTPTTPLPDTDRNTADSGDQAGLETDFAGAQPPLGALPLPVTTPAKAELDPAADQAPADLVAAAGPGELAIDDADDFGADDGADDSDAGEDDLSDDSGEEIFFAQGETFVSIPLGPIIDDLAIHEAAPFSAAILPSSAFLLVDKTVELQARPLRELPELGRLAEDELDRQALVVFVNPRQAKRQCGRTQRVIPLPDPSLLERTAPYLMAQGITRLVIEGALYALPGA